MDTKHQDSFFLCKGVHGAIEPWASRRLARATKDAREAQADSSSNSHERPVGYYKGRSWGRSPASSKISGCMGFPSPESSKRDAHGVDKPSENGHVWGAWTSELIDGTYLLVKECKVCYQKVTF